MTKQREQPLSGGVGCSVHHDSAAKQVSGIALYVDDRLEYPNQLHVYARLSDCAHGLITKLDTGPCYAFPGVALVLTAKQVPGQLDIGANLPGDPLLADVKVEFYGQPILAVAACDHDTARQAALAAIVEYQPLLAVLTVQQALAQAFYVGEPHQHRRGDSQAALARAKHRLSGSVQIGGQEHFYLETQVCSAIPTEEGGIQLYSSTQNPSEMQKLVAKVLGLPLNRVQVDMRRMGGGFGGKETQSAGPACMAALVAKLTGRPTKMRLPRSEDMQMTGKRHPFFNRYQVGYDDDGRICGYEMQLAANCGYSPDLSNAVVDRAMFHADNAYYLGDASITGYRCKTHTASNTAFRGFGGPQGLIMPEIILDQIARALGKDPLDVRKHNLYNGIGGRNGFNQKLQPGDRGRDQTHYHQRVEDNQLPQMIAQLEESCDYQRRRAEIRAYNAANPLLKKGLALTPVKFGISFTAGFLNQAGALIHIYTDGSIHLNHGGTEMGQGLHTKVAQIVAEAFQVDVERIQISATATDKVPNTSPTAASSGSDLNGKAAQNAAFKIKRRLLRFAARHFAVTEQQVRFVNNQVLIAEQQMAFADFIQLAYVNRISLSSTGFYRTPKIHYDRKQARGRPFYYFAYGVACSEVVIDCLSGETKILRADILHDVGASLNPAIDIGQIEGAFVQCAGWLTSEELVWNPQGRLLTTGPASYKIPAITDRPVDFRVTLVENRKNREATVFHSKAVGEPPFMLGISVFCAIKDAIASLADYRISPQLDTPATPERVLWAVEAMQAEAQR
ncbi:MAG: xanthine dehydrogenase molybdopterin binding subunit [Motiliproteus sp.]